MANLYGRMKDEVKSNAVEVTRTAGREISAQLETWDAGVRVELDKNGDYRVFVGDKQGSSRASCRTLVATGNVETTDVEVV